MKIVRDFLSVSCFLILAGFACGEELQPNPLADQCVHDICQSEISDNFIEAIRPADHIKDIERDYDTQIQPRIEAKMQQDFQNKKESQKQIEVFSQLSFERAEYSTDLRIILNGMMVSQFLVEIFSSQAVEASKLSAGGYKIIKERATEIAHQLNIFDVDGALRAAQFMIDEGIFSYFQLPSFMKISVFRRLNFPNLSEDEFLKSNFQSFQLLSDSLNEIIPYKKSKIPSVLAKYLSGKAITDDDSPQFFSELAKFYMFHRWFRPGDLNQTLLNIKRDLPQELKLALDQLSSDRQDQSQFLKPDEMKSNADEVLRFCRQQYIVTMKSFPIQSELNFFEKNLLPRVKDAAGETLKRNGLGHLNDGLKNVNWQIPRVYGNALSHLVRELEEDLEYSKENTAGFERLSHDLKSGNASALGVAAFIVLTSSYDPEEKEIFSSIKADCENVSPLPLKDVIFFQNQSAINVSWQSILNPSVVPLILGHELGHWVYHQEKESGLLNSPRIQCLRKRHLDLTRLKISKNPDTFLEEDFADLFGSAVDREFTKGNSPKHFYCYLRSGPNPESSIQYSTLDQPRDDSHSSALFRMISFATEKGSVPDSCQKIQREAGAEDVWNSCW